VTSVGSYSRKHTIIINILVITHKALLLHSPSLTNGGDWVHPASVCRMVMLLVEQTFVHNGVGSPLLDADDELCNRKSLTCSSRGRGF
jgi:hypothetical protein